MNARTNLTAAAMLAGSIVISALLLTNTWKSTSKANQSIQVTGSAKRQLSSDHGVVRANLIVENANQLQAFRALQQAQPEVLAFLGGMGFEASEIQFKAPMHQPLYQYNSFGEQTALRGHQYHWRFEVSSKRVQSIDSLATALSSLIEQGIQVQLESTEFYFSGLADLKIEIQAEAARDARHRAEKIAEATGRKLGPLTGARMGVLQITPLHSNLISDYGFNDVSSIEKEITAVVSGTFLIE